jgi:hypothetical protein
MNMAMRESFESFVPSRDAGGVLRVVPTLSAEAMARGLRDALDGKPSNVRVRAYAVDDPDDPEAALAVSIDGPRPLSAAQADARAAADEEANLANSSGNISRALRRKRARDRSPGPTLRTSAGARLAVRRDGNS